jgi:hypothetical protein
MKQATINPRDLIEFCRDKAQTGMTEGKRKAIETAYALACYACARGRTDIIIDGRMVEEFAAWIKE